MSQEQENGNEVAEVISEALLSFSEESTDGEHANVVDGLFALSRAVHSGFKWLGNGDAGTRMGGTVPI